MKCPECVKEGKTSRVYEQGGASTAMCTQDFYDEDGRRHHHDPNWHSTSYQCSNGHRWAEKVKHKCWCEKEKGENDPS